MKTKDKHLYLGAGSHRLKDFIHLDIQNSKTFKKGYSPIDVICDISKHIPFEDSTIRSIFSRDTFEHLTYIQLHSCLNECYRVLDKSNGYIRFLVPCFDQMINCYNNKFYDITRDSEKIKTTIHENYVDEFILNILYHDHKYIHNKDTITRFLERANFTDIKFCFPGETSNLLLQEQYLLSETGRFPDIIVEARPKLEKIKNINLLQKKEKLNFISFVNFLLAIINVKISKANNKTSIFNFKTNFKLIFYKLFVSKSLKYDERKDLKYKNYININF